MIIVRSRCCSVLVLIVACAIGTPARADTPRPELKQALLPWAKIVAGTDSDYSIHGECSLPIDGSAQEVTLEFNRTDAECFDLAITHKDYAVEIRRREDLLALMLPLHHVVYVSRGTIAGPDSLKPDRFLKRICGPGTQAANYLPLLSPEQPEGLVALVLSLAKLKYNESENRYQAGSRFSLEVLPEDQGFEISSGDSKVRLSLGAAGELRPTDQFGDLKVIELPRSELESQLARGCARGLELLIPSSSLTKPAQQPRKVPHGELRWVDGQRVVLLSGTPEEIGTAHGQLLKDESTRCMDSVLNVFGTLQTVRTGRWFRHDLQEAAERLLPHIPERHRQETRALAASLDMEPQLVEELNVFPELFHCSGFAVFGAATQGGKLYHGRVLDYMTMIGLQDCAATFIMAPAEQIPFANVGYAAFIGSVSGMNTKTISLGEMGGRGEGAWDGVPMATLMRRALEECSTLEEVISLWRESPRTCEYYYVFAEGKTRNAVGVAARPESIEFIQPGEAHALLGPGIPDAVVLSAGQRLEALRSRVQEKYGQIDAEAGQWLMCRPVAMKSNLHNVLFVPEDGLFYVANADHLHPAAERPYVQLNLNQLLESMNAE
ncbi:C45 family autoproteolytic acyltransferase/hydolase [Planctomicrobium sp. SH661]|uniref:C45 family autoproteolytic acyltransferase/hydolase n=1 Tax=Planctomicrobium sp. SH661 TaxID=3448124 RepID=UPI003F5C1CFE